MSVSTDVPSIETGFFGWCATRERRPSDLQQSNNGQKKSQKAAKISSTANAGGKSARSQKEKRKEKKERTRRSKGPAWVQQCLAMVGTCYKAAIALAHQVRLASSLFVSGVQVFFCSVRQLHLEKRILTWLLGLRSESSSQCAPASDEATLATVEPVKPPTTPFHIPSNARFAIPVQVGECRPENESQADQEMMHLPIVRTNGTNSDACCTQGLGTRVPRWQTFTDGTRIFIPIIDEYGEHCFTDGEIIYRATCCVEYGSLPPSDSATASTDAGGSVADSSACSEGHEEEAGEHAPLVPLSSYVAAGGDSKSDPGDISDGDSGVDHRDGEL